jgi:hypothetical protein
MEHKGIQYQVVQTANPTGFKWSVQLDNNKTKTGEAPSKSSAIFLAVLFIDRAVREQRKAKCSRGYNRAARDRSP